MAEFERLGFIGVGTMGGRMCRNLAAKTQRPVIAYDTSAERLSALSDEGVTAASRRGGRRQCRHVECPLPATRRSSRHRG